MCICVYTYMYIDILFRQLLENALSSNEVARDSVLGLYLRKYILIFETFSFEQVWILCVQIIRSYVCAYIAKVCMRLRQLSAAVHTVNV
jgi:hypothetical protein